ncbi:MAG: hypothetical protein M0P13_07940 [Fibrobacteraceae bacterium]|nr:hypothetical protein [Fibrobacteraceae bacterium]
MKKLLTLQDIQNSNWKERLRDVFAGNLRSAFLHGNCLYEGFDALHEPWQMSLILNDTSAEKLSAAYALAKPLTVEGLQFGFFFSEDFLAKNQKVYPLEFLHISKKNAVLSGEAPLQGFSPDNLALRAECKRELTSRMLQLKREFTRLHYGLTPMDFSISADSEILPVLYGVYFAQKNEFPQRRSDVYKEFPDFELKEPVSEDKDVIDRADIYFKAIQKIIEEL